MKTTATLWNLSGSATRFIRGIRHGAVRGLKYQLILVVSVCPLEDTVIY